MDPGFFRDSDPGFKSPDLSIYKLKWSKWWFWQGFRGAWPKKTVLRVLDKKYNIFFYFYPSFRTFFHGSGFFRIGSGFLADPDPDSEKKSDPDPGKKPGSETLEKVQKYFLHAGFMHTVCMYIYIPYTRCCGAAPIWPSFISSKCWLRLRLQLSINPFDFW